MRKGRGGIAIRRGQHPAIGQDLRLPVGQDEQEGNSWDGWGREERQASPERLGVGSPVAQLHCSPVLGIRKPGLLGQLPCLPLPGVRKGSEPSPDALFRCLSLPRFLHPENGNPDTHENYMQQF